MKANLMTRIGAYFIDVIIIAFIAALMTGFLPKSEKYEKAEEKENKILDKVFSGEELSEETINELYQVRYDIDRETVHITLVSCVLYIAYFGTYAFYNNGKTIGKKLLKIRVKYDERTKYPQLMFIIRACLVHGIISSILLSILVLLIKVNTYTFAYSILSILNTIFIALTLVVSSFREDGKGIHDLICRTQVIRE